MAYITPNKATNSRKHAHHQPIATALVVLLGLMAAPRLACAKPTATPALAPHLLDAITFGKPTSETAHHFDAAASQVINGGLGQPARVLLPLKPRQIYGGQMSFTLRCNPRRLNYITVKYWGNDRGEDLGRLILYCNGLQVGYRMMSDYGLISGAENAGAESYPGSRPFPGRFFYVTEPLPRKLTRGKHHVRLTIQAIGHDWMYGSNFNQYQHVLEHRSRGVYKAYIGTSAFFTPPPGDIQGTPPPPPPIRPAPGPHILQQLKFHVNNVLKSILASKSLDGPQRVVMLAHAYLVNWCIAYHNPAILKRIIRDVDAMASGKGQENEANISWRLYGPVGRAVALLYPELKTSLDQPLILSDGKSLPRRQAWAALLTKTVAYLTTHERYYTNQAMIVANNIYTANQGLEMLQPASAMSEKQARWYLYEAIGLAPWRGNKLPGKDNWQWPFGHHYYEVTPQGLSRELGYVASYGETIIHLIWQMCRYTHQDPRIMSKMQKMLIARGYFMAPGVDHSGYRAMRLEGVISWRHNLYPEEVCYGDRTVNAYALECAALPGEHNAKVIGFAQQCLRDNQLFQAVRPMLYNSGDIAVKAMLRLPGQYAVVSTLAPSPARFPMAHGQSDFAWADPHDGVVVVKYHHTRLYASLYYRAYDGINSLARVHYTTPTIDRLVRAHEQVAFTPSGYFYTRPDDIDQVQFHGFIPPGNKYHEAYAGQRLPIPKLPKGYIVTKGHFGAFARGSYGPYLGRAGFYRLHYGPFLIGMNCSRNHTYVLKIPPGITRAIDLISGREISLTQPLVLKPHQTIILRNNDFLPQ